MTYSLTLKTVGVLLGLLLVAGHALALLRATDTRQWLLRLPRSFTAGVVVLTIDFIWTWVLALKMDWGEFYYLQRPMLFVLPVFFYLTIRFVDEFLAARALGILLLLAAAPLLDAAFLQPQTSRLLVVVLAYAWVVMGMFWVGMPHLMRDQIAWLQRSAPRWQAHCAGGIVYGAAMLVCALIWY